jgi:microsomal dipeptidase-like Zn-dependent dipeptidase
MVSERLQNRYEVRMGSGFKKLLGALFLLIAPIAYLITPGDSSAQSCGGEGQGPCGLTDCKVDLVLTGGKCRHPDCGRDGQKPCLMTQRPFKSCDQGLVELPGMCGVKGACGAEGQRPCLVIERVPSCNSKNLVESGGKCIHPACGRQNERPCVVTERIPSCDDSLVEISGKCLVRGACGAEGQRACTVGERVPSCNPNLAETTARTCVHPDCGRVGQRACPGTERPGIGVSCDVGLIEVPGCTANDCRGSSGMCFDKTVPGISEPSTNMTPLPPKDPMGGYADLHVHMFSHLGFGGGIIAGAPYDPNGGIAKALAPDFGTDLDLVSLAGTPMPVAKCPPLVPNCGKNVLHGFHVLGVDDSMGAGTGDATKTYWGAPYFTGWPKWHTTTHQQVYYKWLERAWRGGMRAMVMLAVNNEFACATSKRLRGTNCSNSMPGIDVQLQAAKTFETWHKAQPGGGWFKIVYSADEAEQTIRAGNLAVILGIESDTLFGCKQLPYSGPGQAGTFSRQSCTPEFVNGEVDKYFASGVRYVFPVHDFDGGFAGSALFMDLLGAANVTIMGKAFVSAPCPGVSDIGSLNCNVRGLTPGAGPALLNKLMDKGMLIDLDHMSAKGIDETFALADARGGYPFFIGHGLFNEVYAGGGNRHERMRTAAQLAKLKQLGSVVSVMTQDELKKEQTTCMHSSVSFAQNLVYAARKMDVVAFGSDFNGFAPHVGPRFGDEACGKEPTQKNASQSKPRLQYPFTIDGFGTFQKQVTGQRTFDFNTDGLAHIGLYPDLLADLTAQGVSIEPLMKSAALVVSAWRKASQPKSAPAPLPMKKIPEGPVKILPQAPNVPMKGLPQR